MNAYQKSEIIGRLLNLLMFLAVLFPFSIFGEAKLSPTVDVSFAKSGKGVVYTIVYGKNTKFNDNENAPYKFIFLDAGKKELGRIEKDFFVKNNEKKAVYTSNFGESSAKITLAVCLYSEKTGLAEKCTVKSFKLEIK
ncbi:hypothetical protein J6Z19_06095 [bacterium]|nr:hypothetical protein [bacterium]